MVAIATDTFVTSMQTYASQPPLSTRTHLLIKTISIRSSHMESPTWLSQVPPQAAFPTFHYRTSSFCCLSIFSSLEHSKHPPKHKQDFNRFREASSQIIFPFHENYLFWRWSPHFSTFKLPNYNPFKKVHAIAMFPTLPHYSNTSPVDI